MAIACGVACLSAAPAWAQSAFRPRVGAGLGLVPPANSQGQLVASDVATESPTPVTYHGGSVMSAGVTVHTIFWAPSGYAFQGSPGNGIPTYEGMIQQFYTDVAHDSGATGTCTNSECNVFTALPQYGQGTRVGAIAPGSYAISYSPAADSIDDSDPYPAASAQCASPGGTGTCITDSQLTAEIDHVVQASPGSPRGLTNLWFVFLPPGVDECVTRGQCGTNAFAGYHGISNLNRHGVTIYAVAIDPIIEAPVGSGADPEGYPDAEVAVNIAAHETIEAMTDPLGTGWMDPDGSETGDKCVDVSEEVGTPLGFDNGSPYNQVINGHHYLFQEVWANLDSAGVASCVQSTTNTTVQLPLPQVNLRQFNPVLTGNVNRSPGGGIGVRVTLLRAGDTGAPIVVARASTTTASDGSWSVSLAPHAVGDDRDEIDLDYSGAGAPQPAHQVIRTGNGGNPFSEAGWTGWFDLDNETAAANPAGSSSLALAPCFQAGLLSYTIDGAGGVASPNELCNTQTDVARVGTSRITAADTLTAGSNDNRAFSSPAGPTPNPLGGLVSLTVPVGEPGSVSPFTSPLAPDFTPGGLPSCTADLELQAVLCDGLVPNGSYSISDGSQHVTGAADPTGTLVTPLRIGGGDAVVLTNGSRTLTTLHVAHLRVSILGEESALAGGTCQPGDYYGAPLSSFATTAAAGLPTSASTGGVALTGEVCPTNGDATGLSTDAISQTDDRSGGQTETEVPDIEDTSPMEGETMYGKFTALAESGLAAPGNTAIPTDVSTRITLRILTAGRNRTAFTAHNVDTPNGVHVPALKPGSYLAIWTLIDANGDTRILGTRFIEQSGRTGRAPLARIACRYAGSGDQSIRCRVSFPSGRKITGTVRLRLTRGGTVVGLGHGRVRHGQATVTLHVLRRVSRGSWRATLVLARLHLATVTRTVRLGGVS